MNPALLVIDTALAAQSLALLDADGGTIAHSHSVIGRGHAETLMPALATLLDRRVPQRILVDIGPGSFTGLRIGIAAARALGLAWQIPVMGYSSLALIAAPVFAAHSDDELGVVAEAGRGQLYVQRLARDLGGASAIALDADEVSRWLPRGMGLAGPGAARVPGARVLADAWPDARDAWRLPATRLGAPTPHYVRPPDVAAVAA